MGKTQVPHWVEIEYISEGQPSPNELAFGIELGPNPHSKCLLWSLGSPLYWEGRVKQTNKVKEKACKKICKVLMSFY